MSGAECDCGYDLYRYVGRVAALNLGAYQADSRHQVQVHGPHPSARPGFGAVSPACGGHACCGFLFYILVLTRTMALGVITMNGEAPVALF